MSRSTTLRLTRILAGRSQEDIKRTASAAATRLGFPYLIFSGSFSLRDCGEIRFDNLPDKWHRHSGGRSRDLLPGSLRRQALHEVTPLVWSQAARDVARSLTKVRDCGLATGVSCPVRGPSGEWSLTSFALPGGGAQA